MSHPSAAGTPRFTRSPVFSGEALTPRELQTIRLIAVEDLTPAQVAHRLGVSRRAVEGFQRAIYRKLRASSPLHAIQEAAQRGLLG